MVKKAARPNHLLRTARKERGWTQRDVADRIGAPLALNVTRWEGGTAFPSAHYIEKLCQVFGRSAKELGLVQEEYGEILESIDDPGDANKDQDIPLPLPPATHRFTPKLIIFTGLALLIVIIGGGLLYASWNATHRPLPKRIISPADTEATARAVATATVVATYPDPYPSDHKRLAFYDRLNEPYLWVNSANKSIGSKCQFAQDGYHASTSKIATTSICMNSDIDKSDFTVEVQMKIIQGDCGGMLLRSDEPKDYQFSVCRDGTYSFSKFTDYTQWKELSTSSSPAITVGVNQVNVIAVVANKSTFDLYVNKQKIGAVHDDSYSHGQIALLAVSNTMDATEVVYNYAKVWVA